MRSQMIRENRIKVLLLTVTCLFTVLVFAGAVVNYLENKELDLMPLYGGLILIVLFGSSVALASDRYNAAVFAVVTKKILLRREDREVTKLFEELVGKEVLVVMAAGGSYKGRVDAVEANWVKLVDKKGGQGLLNSDLIASVTVLPEKTSK